MTEVELLHAAAARLRALADGTTPGPWEFRESFEYECGEPQCCYEYRDDAIHEPDGTCLEEPETPGMARFVATLDPLFARAVADWLESTANDVEHVHDPVWNLTSTTVARARKVARRVLGDEFTSGAK